MYGFGVMCQQLVGQCRESREDGERERERARQRLGVSDAPLAADPPRLSDGKASKRDKKKDKERSNSEEDLEFIQQLGALCASETPSRRPTAAACLSRCLQRLGRRMALCSAETARARVATWTDARMDVGTGGKKSAKEAREKAGRRRNRNRRGAIIRGNEAVIVSTAAPGRRPWRRAAASLQIRGRSRRGAGESETVRDRTRNRNRNRWAPRHRAGLAARRSRRRRETRPGGVSGGRRDV